MGVTLQRLFAPFQGGGFLTAHLGLLFYFLQLLFSLLNNPLFAPRIIQALKNHGSPLTLYLLHSYFIFAKVSLGGAWIVCLQHAVLWHG
jgi:hypothetical protein